MEILQASIVFAAALVLSFLAACGSSQTTHSASGAYHQEAALSPYPYKSRYVTEAYYRNEKHPLLYHASTYETMTHLDKNLPLFYEGDEHPEVKKHIVHGERTARSKSCVHATINALEALQEDARKLEANAIVNLTPTWEGEKLLVGRQYFCAGGSVTFGIVWEGDFVVLEKEKGEEEAPAASEGQEGAEGAGAAQPAEEPEEEITVSITEEGELVYDDKTVSSDYLLGILEEKKKAAPKVRITLKARPDTPYGKIDAVKQALLDAGFEDVSVTAGEK
jgi:biopolymer transport protein ExbD